MKNASFVNLALEIFRFTELYTANILNANADDQYLLASDLIVDFTKDLNIREVQFVEIFESYKKIVRSLSRLGCLECPQFNEHVNVLIFFFETILNLFYLNAMYLNKKYQFED